VTQDTSTLENPAILDQLAENNWRPRPACRPRTN